MDDNLAVANMPSSWAVSSIGDATIMVSTNGLKVKQNEYLPSGQYPVIDQGQDFIGGFTDDETKLVSCELPVIVFGDHTKVIKFVNRPFVPGADGVKVIKPLPFIDAKLFEMFLHRIVGGLEDRGYARHYQFLAKASIPIPPFNEQHRIVAKIEELFSELEKGVESLKVAREQLKVYRQSVLKAAFEGRLTESWRKEHAAEVHGSTSAVGAGRTGATELESANELLTRIKAEREARYTAQLAEWQQSVSDWEAEGKPGKKPTKPQKPKAFPPITSVELTDLAILPDGWGWANFRNIYAEASLGKMLDKQKNTGDLKPYLRNKSVRWGSFDLSDISEMRFESDEYERYGLDAGDLVICEGGEPGRCAIWKTQNAEMRIQKALHRVRFFKDTINGNYVLSFISYSALNGHLATAVPLMNKR